MQGKLRKLYMWVASLAAVVGIYFIINLISQREPIYFEKRTGRGDVNSIGEFGGEIGKIGEVGIADMKEALYSHRNKKGEVDREVGFKKLIRSIEEKWEVEKPFINFYREDLICYITADKGSFEVETVVKQPTPKDGSLNGNVVMHIVPLTAGDIEETFIYVDDIVFEGERSLATTAGPIKLVSEDIQLTGRGLEFVYNEQSGGLEYLKIIDVDRLILKVSSDVSLFGSDEGSSESSGAVTKRDEKNVKDEKVLSEKQEATLSANTGEIPEGGKLYKWVLSKNVVIDCPEQIIFADQVFINNILMKKGTKGQERDVVRGPDVNEGLVSDVVGVNETAVAEALGPNEPAEQLMEIVVSCEGGILVTAMDSNIMPPVVTADSTVTGGRGLAVYGDPNGRATLEARRIDYCALSNVALLRGRCLATMTMLKNERETERKYSLSAPRIRAELSEQKQRDSSALAGGFKHLQADGGGVVLAVRKLEQNKLLGFTKLSCVRFDYEAGRQLCWATGPGRIEVDNSKMTLQEIESVKKKEKEGADKFSLQKACYAIVENFDNLEYYLDTERIVAGSSDGNIYIGYMPVIDGQEGKVVKVNVGHIDAQLRETEKGRTELLALHASEGVTYEEEGKKNIWGEKKNIYLVGSDLFYDREESLITVWGDESWPCTLNGVSVDGIEYNLLTGRLKEARVLGPGIIW